MNMDEQLAAKLKYLRLGALPAGWHRYLDRAGKGNWSHARFLKYLINEKYQIKKENARKMRTKRAKIPENLVIEAFPFSRQPKLKKKKIIGLYDGFDYMTRHRNIILLGPTGVGKTGLATGFLIHAIDNGYSGTSAKPP
jgi:DNA replication protein DnaC